MDRTEEVLLEQVPLTGDPKQDEVQLAKHKVLQNDILAHQVSVDSVNKAGQGFLATADNPEVARVIEGKLDTVNHKWEDLVQKSADRQQELEKCLGEAKTFQDQVDQLLDWLESTDKLISRAEPVGGLPDSAREQLDKHKALMKQFGDKEELLKKLLEEGAKMKEDIGPGGDNQGGISQKLQELDKKWNDSVQKAKEKQTQLEDALKNAQEFDVGLQDFIVWLTAAEKTLTNTKRPSTIYENVQKQICDHREFVKDVAGKREDVDKLDRLGTQLKYFSQKKDVIVIKNMLVNVQNRYQRVGSRCNEKTRELESGMKLAKQFDEQYRNLFDWLDENEKFMDDDRSVGTDPEFLKSQRLKHKEFQKKLSMVQPTYDGVVRAGRNLREKSNQEDTKLLNAMMTDLKDKWDLLSGKAVDRQRKLEEALLYSGQFKDALQSLLEWMYQVEPTLADDNPVHGDKDTVANLMDAHQGFQRDLASRKNSVRSVKKSAKGLMDKSSEDTSHLKTKLDELDTKWETVCELNVQKQARLEDALKEAEEFNSAVQNLLDSFAATEHSMKFSGPLAESEDKLTEQLENHKDAKRMLDAEKNRLNDVIRQGEDILSKCHPDAIPIVKRHLGILNARWEDIQALSEQKESRLNDALRKVQDDSELLDQVMEFLEDAEHKLAQQEIEPIPEDMEVVEKLLEEHNHFEESVASKQPDIDRLVKPHKRKRSVDSNSGIPISFDRSRRGRSSRPRSRDASPAADPVKNPKIAALDNQWKNVWLRAMNRRRALQDVQEKQNELQSMKNFNFEDWRARYLKWMQHKKARVMDFFRKLDHDRDGKLSRKDFIDGVADSNFDTTQPEMNAVVDYLDPLNEGFIDYKKFLNALYPDSERSKQPATEAEKIANEVERQVCKCQCTKKFKVQKLGESKYRFGDSQMMRLVRILRSTVMVRVGGGWMALDEFLVKNDPCRAKGRTNIEIKEKFILASGVSQSMAAFRRSRSPSECSTSSVGSSSMSGSPFIKSKRNIKRPWQQGHTTTPRVTSTTRVNPDGSFTRTTREAKGGGDSVTRKSTTRSVTPGYLDTPRSSRGTRAKSPLGGVATKKKVLAQRTEVDVEEKKTSVGTQGLVTVRTVTEEERTVTKPTHRHTVNATSRLMEPTTSSRRKQKQAKPPAPRWK
ncbi:putative microtubule-actin cross-linking factor 1 isoform X5 [Apostichopus japonicus]|uniref:Putative microtubule-actin cross-linking factor 1 isoform X5 n=1 Tax=Stichopus japonicus TaxID=307972 RepID=A0A2G8JQ88_STIJA|nr:putative microtubule-actin cross-linking factor 1 isoform X5 [Apostichopus japonicus]